MPDPTPSIRYCRRGRQSIAWTAIGHGAPLVYCAMVNSAEQFVHSPLYALLGRVGRARKVVLYDGLGSGLSDRASAAMSVEDAMEDLEAVVEAAGLDRFALITGIAAHLGMSEKTVRNHITPIFSKPRVENRSQAIVRARDAGLGSPRQ